MTIMVLFGAGASLAGGCPSTWDITERVSSGRDIVRYTSGQYFLEKRSSTYARHTTDEYLDRVLAFLRRLAQEVDGYYGDLHRPTNYEDLYYLASQVYESEMHETDNPAIQSFIEDLRTEFAPLMRAQEGEIREAWTLGELARETVNYLHDIIARLLSGAPTTTDHFNWLLAMHRSGVALSLATLAHDRSLEIALQRAAIEFTDGFGDPVSSVRYWEPDRLLDAYALRVLKLHGSVDWYRFRTTGGGWEDERIGLLLSGDPDDTLDPEGRPQEALDGRPLLLAGTFNKVFNYSRGIFADLLMALRLALRSCRRLVVCGYSFGDKGVNTQILEWMYATPDHRLVVVHPKPDDLVASARVAIAGKWERWRRDGRVAEIHARMEDVSYSDIYSTVVNA